MICAKKKRHPKSVKRRHESRKNDLSKIDLNEGKRAHTNHKKEQDTGTNLYTLIEGENPLGYLKSKTLKTR